jgi:TonB family protein
MGEMPLNALLFSKSPEATRLPPAAIDDLGVRIEASSDIFSAIKKATEQSFSCLIIDWSDRPEATFLLKRARESKANRDVAVIVIVDHVPSPVEVHENRLDYFIHRPIAADEVREVFAKACRQMKGQAQASLDAELLSPLEKIETSQTTHEPQDPGPAAASEDPMSEMDAGPNELEQKETPRFAQPAIVRTEPRRPRLAIGFRPVFAAVLALAATFCIWRSREALLHLAHARPALLSTDRRSAQPVRLPMADGAKDTYFSRAPQDTNSNPKLALIPVQADLPEGTRRLRKAFDFPLPNPVLMRSDPPPSHAGRPEIPESLRSAAPITRPVVAPAQIVTVSAPPLVIPQFSEAVSLSEEAARAMLARGDDPVYPPEVADRNVQGPVVLQAVIGKDGSVEDVKIVRGYFVLGRAAIAAVKQWQFHPYLVNGRPAKAQTLLTIDFGRRPN